MEHNLVHEGKVDWVAFSADGKRLVSRSDDRTISVWDTVASRLRARWRNHEGAVPIAALSPDGTRLASCGGFTKIDIWEMPSCVNVGTRAVKCDDITALAFSNDGQRVYLAGEKAKGGFFREWLPGGRLSKGETLPAPVQSMAVSPDDRWLAVGLQTCPGDLRLFDTKKKSEVRTATQLWPVRAIAYSPQGDVIATSSGSEIKLWRASLEPAGELNNHRYLVAGLCFSPDGRTLATVSTDQIVRLWDVESRTQRASLKSPLGHTSSVAIAPCGKSIAVGGTDAVIIWSPDELAGTS